MLVLGIDRLELQNNDAIIAQNEANTYQNSVPIVPIAVKG